MLEWFDVTDVYREALKHATARNPKSRKAFAPEADVFLYEVKRIWQGCIDLRLDEVSEMVAYGLSLPAPRICYDEGVPLMPPSHLTSGAKVRQDDLELDYEDDFETDARGFPCSLYSPVLTLHMARLIKKTWGGTAHSAVTTLRLWDENCQRGELLHNLLVASIFGLWPVYDEAAASTWLAQNGGGDAPVQGALDLL